MNNQMIESFEKYGIDYTAEMFSEYLSEMISTEDIAIQFVLEELEAASQGSYAAKIFVESSGFDEDDYAGAMHNSFKEVDGEDGPQQEILNLCMMLYPNQELMTEFRIKTVDNIMKHWKLGKYSPVNEKVRLINVVEKIHDLEEGVFANINNDLNNSVKQDHDIMILMAYGYARRTVAAGLYLQAIFNRASYEQASNIFKSLQLKTGQSMQFQEEASKQAEELLLSYDKRLTKEFTIKITAIVEHNQVDNAYENGKYLIDEQVFQLFAQSNNTNLEWKDNLIKWAKNNKLPKRETITNNWGESEYIGFPHNHKSIDYFLNINEFNIWSCKSGTHENYIKLNHCNLTELPEELYLLKGIYVLWLSNNKLTELSENIDKLEFLYSLDLGSNNLTSLPNNIVNLQNLNDIRLYNNPNLVLTEEQKNWILSFNSDEVSCDDDLFDRNMCDDENPF
ncbi:MAG: hypothetical protein U9N59_03225 [Campylobacterota bacterium]|nr:hypothetical protein [Campylobacterota bacterium]